MVAKDVLVSEEMANKFKTEKDTPYLRFVRGEGLDIISAQYVPDLCTVELKPWARRGEGAKGVFINHEASRTSNDCYVCEIPPGGQLAPQRQLFEEMVFVLDGRGSTTVSLYRAISRGYLSPSPSSSAYRRALRGSDLSAHITWTMASRSSRTETPLGSG